MADPGRVVVVAAGFALWAGGRCVAAARWSDVRRLRAYHRDAPPSDALHLGVDLVDGTIMELHHSKHHAAYVAGANTAGPPATSYKPDNA